MLCWWVCGYWWCLFGVVIFGFVGLVCCLFVLVGWFSLCCGLLGGVVVWFAVGLL